MSLPILATKLYTPAPRPGIVRRPRLIERLNEGLCRPSGVTLVSASAGFGKTTLLGEWIAGGKRPAVWLSLDERDSDLVRFLSYLVAALQKLGLSPSALLRIDSAEGIAPSIGEGVLSALEGPQPPPVEWLLTTLLNEILTVPEEFILVLDDYHLVDSRPVDQALTFLIEHLPPPMHLVIATREDPQLPLSQLRVRGRLVELRVADLRFTDAEAAEFLNQGMGLNLSAEDIAALETRTEGWIAGLQLAALAMQGQVSMQGPPDAAAFVRSFTGSHHFVLDYLVEQVLQKQPDSVQSFLLRTSVLERLCGRLCDAVLLTPPGSGQATLEYLEHGNLFIVPLDDERRWYRYHHLFGDLLCKRLETSLASKEIVELHVHASEWYEDDDLMLEAFHHAAAANDIERAVRLMESKRMPLHVPGAMTAILNWLESLPTAVLNARPALWWKQAELLLLNGQTTDVEKKLQAAEAALADASLSSTEVDDQTRDLIGKIAAIRSNLALAQQQPETILVQARRALEYLHANNLPDRSAATRDLGFAYYLQGNRIAAGRTFAEALSLAQESGDKIEPILATIGLGLIQELENQLNQAAESYQSVLPRIEEYSRLNAGVVYLGLARICYEWNDLDAAERYGEQSLQLAQQYSRIVSRFIMSGVFLARLKLARGDVSGAAALLAQAEQAARQHNFLHRMPEIAAVQVLVLLRQDNRMAAAQLAQTHELPLSQARVRLAEGEAAAALALLVPYRQQMEAKGWQDERLKAMVLQAVALHAAGKDDEALQALADALSLAEPGGFVRLFVDEGLPMAQLLTQAGARGVRPDYVRKLLAALRGITEAPGCKTADERPILPSPSIVEPLSEREVEVLRLIAEGLSNREIGARLFLALDTVKGHNRRIFDKLQVQRRTEAIARARELGLL